jgi:hypothetical protein
VHEHQTREPTPPLADSKDEIWDPKMATSAIPNLGVSHQIIRTPQIFARNNLRLCKPAYVPMAAHLEHSALRDRKVTETRDLASNNLTGKKRTINTRPNPKLVRAKCAGVT